MEKSNKKPIEEIAESLKEINEIITADIRTIKNDISYIKSKIKEKVIQEKIEEQRLKEECIIENKSWWWG